MHPDDLIIMSDLQPSVAEREAYERFHEDDGPELEECPIWFNFRLSTYSPSIRAMLEEYKECWNNLGDPYLSDKTKARIVEQKHGLRQSLTASISTVIGSYNIAFINNILETNWNL
jgi:hypothetical protein